jgi:peptide/nickel transport system substrate-binding protein
LLTAVWLGTACAGAPGGLTAEAPPAQIQRTLVSAVRVEPKTLAARVVGQNLSIASFLSRRMFNADLALLDDQGEPHPYLAEALPQLNTESWKVSSDGTMETIYRLRPNLVWHNGTPLTADDFVFSWNLYATPELGSANSPPISLIQNVEAQDSRTIVIQWTRPYPSAGALQSLGPGATGLPPLPKSILGPVHESGAEALLNSPFWTTGFVGLGPYRLEHWGPGAYLEAAAFDRHALGAPKVARIKILFMGDGNTTLAGMLAGEVQLSADSGMTSQQASELLRHWPTGAGSMVSQASLWKAAHFQSRPDFVTPASLQDIRVRKALAHAVDRPAINEVVYDGQYLIADSMFPPNSVLGRAVDAAIPKYPLDLRQTAQLMSEAGFTRETDGMYASPSGGRFSAELKASAGADSQTEMAAVASGWRQVGFDFQESATPAALAQDVRARSSFPGIQIITAALGESGIINMTTNNIPRPENNWRSGGSSISYAGYATPEMDRFVAAYATALAPPDRIRAAVDIAKLHSGDFPAISLFFPTTPWVFSSELSGPTSTATETNMGWNIHAWELK